MKDCNELRRVWGSHVAHDPCKEFPVKSSRSCPKELKSVRGHKDAVQILHLNLPNTTKWNMHFKVQLTTSINLAMPKHALRGMFRRYHREAYNIINESKKRVYLRNRGFGPNDFWGHHG